jgi:type VI secretion system secreted protein VgrG
VKKIVPTYTQADRPLKITTPLGQDILLIRKLKFREEVSHLFDMRVDLVADLQDEVKFDQIIGQSVTVEMRLLDGSLRYFNGIVNRFTQGARDEKFMHFRARLVPRLWFLSKKIRSRIFQHLTVLDILNQVLTGFSVSYEISGTYYQRDFCVQYRESDFAFASRPMEEEGIHYFFKHSDGNHQMLVTDIPNKHPTVPGPPSAIYEEMSGDVREDMRVTRWRKTQNLRSGQCTLWDHCFELPGNHLEAKEETIASVQVGKVTAAPPRSFLGDRDCLRAVGVSDITDPFGRGPVFRARPGSCLHRSLRGAVGALLGSGPHVDRLTCGRIRFA